jgi:uncharacterized protein (TIGR03437 family)
LVNLGDSYNYTVTSSAVDAGGTMYLTGSRYPGSRGWYSVDNPPHGFAAKVDPAGNVTLLAAFGGKGTDQGNGIAVDGSGNVYVAGTTSSPDFPVHGAVQSGYSNGSSTGFLMKLKPDGTVLYSTFLGGTTDAYRTGASSGMNAVAADSLGNAYVTGSTYASDYGYTAGLPNDVGYAPMATGGISVAFFAKVSAAGDKILYAGGMAGFGQDCGMGDTCFFGSVDNSGTAIAVDPAGNAYIGGYAGGSGLPTTPGALRTTGLGAFVAKVNAAGTALVYVTLLGSANYYSRPVSTMSNPGNVLYAIAADASGNAYIAGYTADPNFPATPGSFQTVLAGQPSNNFHAPPSDAFVAKIDPTGTAMVWATFLGGSGNDYATGIALDPAGDVWVSGSTSSADFPLSPALPGGEFLAELNSTGQSLMFAAAFPGGTVGGMLAIDQAGAIHGATSAGVVFAYAPHQSAPGLLFGLANAAGGSIGNRVAPGEMVSIYGLNLTSAAAVSGAFDANGFLPTALGQVEVDFDGTPAPLVYVSGTRIDAMVPLELAVGAPAALRLKANGVALPDFALGVDPAIPAVFKSGDGSAFFAYAAALNQDGTVNSASNPANDGSLVSVWATGVGWTAPGLDGQRATAASLSFFACDCALTQYGTNQNVVPAYAGAAPGMVAGVVQINFQVKGSYYGQYAYGLAATGLSAATYFSIYVAP